METINYMVLGFILIFGVLVLHIASIYVRTRNMHRDLEMLGKLERSTTRKQKPGKKSKRR